MLLTLTATNLCMSYGIITMVSPFTKMPLMKGNLKDASWVDSSFEFCSFICIGPHAFTSRNLKIQSHSHCLTKTRKLGFEDKENLEFVTSLCFGLMDEV